MLLNTKNIKNNKFYQQKALNKKVYCTIDMDAKKLLNNYKVSFSYVQY